MTDDTDVFATMDNNRGYLTFEIFCEKLNKSPNNISIKRTFQAFATKPYNPTTLRFVVFLCFFFFFKFFLFLHTHTYVRTHIKHGNPKNLKNF